MSEQVYIGNFPKGVKLDRLPFNIDNDTFYKLFNAYVWRGRVKRKRGTSFLGILQKQVQAVSGTPLPWQVGQFNLVGGQVNLLGALAGTGATIVPGSINLTVQAGGAVYTEPSPPTGQLLKNGSPGLNSINYSTGLFSINVPAVGTVTGTFSYYPGLPVMGLEDNDVTNANFPILQAFDTTYSYGINQSKPKFFYSTSYYKNTNNPVTWSNGDFAQFWSCNYQSAFWATNNKSGFHFVNGTFTSSAGGGTLITFNFKSVGVNFNKLIVGDKLWFNEWNTGGSNINGVVGTVSNVTDAINGNYVVTFSSAQVVAGTGITQLLTNSIVGQDGIRWYDGDPTSGTGLPVISTVGWVNFAPPLTALNVSINDQQAGLYYLVGALAIVPYKDRLVFFSPQIQKSDGSAVIQLPLQDTVIWSWNGTPYYNSLVPTDTGGNSTEMSDTTAYYVDQTGKGGYLSAGVFQPIKTVLNNEDVLLVGFGGTGKKTRFVYTGNDLQPFLFYLINSELPSTSTFSGVVLDRGGIEIGNYGITLTTQQSCQRIDLDIPDEVFKIQNINNGLDRVNAIRDYYREWIYFSYPTGDGVGSDGSYKFPSQSFLFNYRDNTWAILRENYTHHGLFRNSSQYSWDTLPYKTWANWTEPWNSGSAQALFPSIIAGTPQGYVVMKDADGGGESKSGTILSISDDGSGFTQIQSINHCVNDGDTGSGGIGDYLFFQNSVQNYVSSSFGPYARTTITGVSLSNPCIITSTNSFLPGQSVYISNISGTTELNGNTYTVLSATSSSLTIDVDSTLFTTYVSGGTVDGFNNIIGCVTKVIDKDNFVVDILFQGTGYFGLGTFARLCQPLIQTKQFNFYWDQGRQVILGAQKYLLDRTASGQVTLNINLSQDPDTNWNQGPIVPNPDSLNNSLIYSQLLYTCPESTNLGLTPYNINLQTPTSATQFQIWHRVNTSLMGESVQLGVTLNDDQMRDLTLATSEISLHGIQFSVKPGPLLA